MLDGDEAERQAQESEEAFSALEAALLGIVAGALLAAPSFGAREINAGSTEVRRQASKAVADASKGINEAVRRDLRGALVVSALRDADALGEGVGTAKSFAREAEERAEAAMKSAARDVRAMTRGMSAEAARIYREGCREAKRLIMGGGGELAINHREVMARVVADMARQGVTAFSYRRKDGTVVRVPADVGIRRVISNAARQRRVEQTLSSARKSRSGLVEVSKSGNPRPSHEKWEGRIYRVRDPLTSDPNFEAISKYPSFDAVVGNQIEDYNCQHEVSPYVEGGKRAFKDPNEGTGYTPAEHRAATTRQRRLENEVRKDEREIEALKAGKLADTQACKRANARLRSHRAQLSAHIAAHPKILRRERHRESIYETARKEAGAYGRVHLNSAQQRRVERAAEIRSKATAEWEARAGDAARNAVTASKQRKHVPGTKEYALKVEQAQKSGLPMPSRLAVSLDEAEKLVRRYAGKGRPIIANGKWTGKEKCMADSLIGYVVDDEGNERPTRGFIIHYAKNDAHIVPAKDEGGRLDDDDA